MEPQGTLDMTRSLYLYPAHPMYNLCQEYVGLYLLHVFNTCSVEVIQHACLTPHPRLSVVVPCLRCRWTPLSSAPR